MASAPADLAWEPHVLPGGDVVRVRHTACCGAFELASLGGQYFVLRPAEVTGEYEETARGRYITAVAAYVALLKQHHAEHLRRGQTPERDRLLDHPG
ncbi:hypothetical protein [Nonomuraea harbinensis]|uniref:Uncharacterized protein n=1 Tax=Nonomuraea harbinensis TaxID=1286938 RepID=A0ABW1BP31_9ACTN|nr:hypothetical protein [Nonomuraea harbinensis]